MGLITMQTTTMKTDVKTPVDAWTEVIGELTDSCMRRASGDALWTTDGAVGVLRGAGTVMWVHGAEDGDYLAGVLAASPEVPVAYVEVGETATIGKLASAGWQHDEVMHQLVHDGVVIREAADPMPEIVQLHPGDMADVRDLLREHGDTEEEVLATSYGDDFFTVAAPVWLLGARDENGRLVGLVGVRRQGRSAMGFALTVDSAWRGTGLSTALVAAGLRLAVEVGAEFVHVLAGDRGLACLLACGFVPAGRWQRMLRS